MRYVIAAATELAVSSCRASLGDRDDLEYRVGSVAQTGWDCDAAIVNFPLAHDRYGGKPRIGHAQVLENHRQDGAPAIILATPPIPLEAASRNPTDEQIQNHVAFVIASCVAAFRKYSTPDRDAKILIHLEGAGIDRKGLAPVVRGVAAFLAEDKQS